MNKIVSLSAMAFLLSAPALAQENDMQSGQQVALPAACEEAASQGGHTLRKVLCDYVLNIPEHKLRVVTGDVGGGFGMKIFVYPEYAAILHAAYSG